MIDRWDCITLNERTVHSSTFAAAEKDVLRWNDQLNIGASEFELLSATAFDLFRSSGVDFGVVEFCLGGRDDATNMLEN
ncbi:folylpolyglutamate synthase [Pyricularia oryzae]|nr:folylpolyglutamate synthase [Pyricularia oryzae]KAI7917283.1 folylpolyglutamate synthase [Pyricularia oryzae]